MFKKIKANVVYLMGKLALRAVKKHMTEEMPRDFVIHSKMASELASMFVQSKQTQPEDFVVAICPHGHVSFAGFHLTQEEWAQMVMHGDKAFAIAQQAQERSDAGGMTFEQAMNSILAEQGIDNTTFAA
jgi:hypothetical protein